MEIEAAKGFSIRTPTARVTDLGTEFGVEVKKDGLTISQVFRGSVRVQVVGESGKHCDEGRVLSANESAEIGVLQNASAEKSPIRVIEGSRDSSHFVRKLPRHNIRYLSLVDLASGGDGTSNHSNLAIDPSNGCMTKMQRQYNPDRPTYLASDGAIHRVQDMPAVDCVFIPDGKYEAFPVDSAGHLFRDFPKTTGTTPDYLWAGGRNPVKDGSINPAMLGGVDYTTPGHSWLYMHANKGISFDLNAIRKQHPEGRLLRFLAMAGNTEPYSANGDNCSADLWVLVDGQTRFRRREINGLIGAFPIVVPLHDGNRFLTLVSTDAGNGGRFDWIVFGDARLEIVCDGLRVDVKK